MASDYLILSGEPSECLLVETIKNQLKVLLISNKSQVSTRNGLNFNDNAVTSDSCFLKNPKS